MKSYKTAPTRATVAGDRSSTLGVGFAPPSNSHSVNFQGPTWIDAPWDRHKRYFKDGACGVWGCLGQFGDSLDVVVLHIPLLWRPQWNAISNLLNNQLLFLFTKVFHPDISCSTEKQFFFFKMHQQEFKEQTFGCWSMVLECCCGSCWAFSTCGFSLFSCVQTHEKAKIAWEPQKPPLGSLLNWLRDTHIGFSCSFQTWTAYMR